MPTSDYLTIDGGSRITTSGRRERLLEDGLVAPECAGCGGRTWQGAAMRLELDHINGDRYDNRIESLRLVCPNCHALTPTFRGRNIGRYRLVSRDAPP